MSLFYPIDQVDAKGIRITISDLTNPDNYLQAARLWAGLSLSIADGVGRDWTIGVRDTGAVQLRRLKFSIASKQMTQALALGDASDLAAPSLWAMQQYLADGTKLSKSRGGQVYDDRKFEVIAIPRTSDLAHMHRVGLYGHVVRHQPIQHTTGPYHRWQCEIEELR